MVQTYIDICTCVINIYTVFYIKNNAQLYINILFFKRVDKQKWSGVFKKISRVANKMNIIIKRKKQLVFFNNKP